jgi:hypothetical protein
MTIKQLNLGVFFSLSRAVSIMGDEMLQKRTKCNYLLDKELLLRMLIWLQQSDHQASGENNEAGTEE